MILANGHICERYELKTIIQYGVNCPVVSTWSLFSPDRDDTSILLQPLRVRCPNIIQTNDLLNNLIVQVNNILALDICRAVLLQKFELRPHGKQFVQYWLLLRIERDAYCRRIGHVSLAIVDDQYLIVSLCSGR